MHEPNLHSCSSLHNQQTPIKKSLLDVVEGTNSAKSFKVSLDNPVDQVLVKIKSQLPDMDAVSPMSNMWQVMPETWPSPDLPAKA